MKLNRFRERSLIMGAFLGTQALQKWMTERQKGNSNLSFLGNLILAALHFEGKQGRVGPSRLATTIGFSRSRVSQELSKLVADGLVKRNLDSSDARSFSVSLTSAGERQAVETIKNFSRLQDIVDRAIGEKQAEAINVHLLDLVKVLNQKSLI